MDWAARFFRKLQILFRRERFASELDEEMAFHRAETAREFEAEGMMPEDARYAAMRQFGNTTRFKERSQETVGFRMESILQDLRFAARQLRKNPGFAWTAVLVLALGICASVSIFAFVDAALIKPLPYKNPGGLVGVYESAAACPRCNLSYEDYLDWKKASSSVFRSFDAWTSNGYLMKIPSGVVPALGLRVTPSFLQTLGVTPALGRDLRAEDAAPGSPHTALVTYTGWQKYYGGRRDVVGQTVTLDNALMTIVGVLPRGFQFAPRGGAEFVVPIQELNSCEKRRGCHNLYGVARLKDGASVSAALAAMKSIASQLEREYPGTNRGQGAVVLPLSEVIAGNIRPILLTLLSGAALLLLIATVNVASLLLVRAESRRREMAVRGALGAAPVRLMRQMVTEGLALAAVGSILGAGAAFGMMQLLLRLIPKSLMEDMPYLAGMGLNWRVAAFAVAISLLAAAAFAITPAARLPFQHLRDELAEGSRGSAGRAWRRFGANFVVLELAIAMVLLAGASLLGKSFYRLLHVPLGFDASHLATISVAAPDNKYGKDPQAIALSKELIAGMAALPGVESAAMTSDLPANCNCDTTWFRVLGKPWNGEHNDAPEREVSSGYFQTLHARLLRGRYFTEGDDESKPPVVIINQTLAKKYFLPGENPLGQKIGDNDLSPKSLREIVGVIDDVREAGLDDELAPAVYYPLNQSPDTYFSVLVRTSQAPSAVLASMTAELRHIDPEIGSMNETTMEDHINESPAAYIHRSSAWLVGGFAAIALLLGVVGLYGVIAYSVSQRTREIGVRMALGAQRGAVYRLILREAGWLTAIGIFAGALCSLGAGLLMRKLLFGVGSWDAPTLIAVSALLAGAAAAASYLPARRAASVNPVEALRAE
jgi:macrolide transport system ATP-binding/permease protein